MSDSESSSESIEIDERFINKISDLHKNENYESGSPQQYLPQATLFENPTLYPGLSSKEELDEIDKDSTEEEVMSLGPGLSSKEELDEIDNDSTEEEAMSLGPGLSPKEELDEIIKDPTEEEAICFDPGLSPKEELDESVENPTEEEAICLGHSLKRELHKIVQVLKEKEVLPDIVEQLMERRKLNCMVLDLYDYDRGYAVSFREYGCDVELFHGEYSYAVSLTEYISDGQIPYEIFDLICEYEFQIFYDGYVVCQLRLNFGLKDNVRSHYVLLKHSIQTIVAACLMKCKSNSSLKFEEERARLIKYNSPDLCLDPDPVVAEIICSNELNRHPFVTPYLKNIVLNEKARREMGVVKKPKPQESGSSNIKPEKQENWSFRLSVPTKEEAELTQTSLDMEYKVSIKAYLRERPICFPDEKSFTGFHVEIENFEYEYKKYTKKGEVESVIDKFCIAVLDDKEYYYGACQLNLQKATERKEPCGWWDIGSRELLDIYVNAFTYEEMKLTSGGMKITHYRMFDEKTEYFDGKTKIVRQKLEVPVNQVVMELPPPPTEDESVSANEEVPVNQVVMDLCPPPSEDESGEKMDQD